MRRWLVMGVSFVLTAALSVGSAFAEGITWWEHSNPPHNNYSKELVAEWNKQHPSMPVEYEFFAMTPYFQKHGVAAARMQVRLHERLATRIGTGSDGPDR